MELDAEAYRLLFDANPRSIIVSDHDTLQIVLVNAKACEEYGWSRDEFQALTLRDIRPPDDLRAFEQSLEHSRRNPRTTYSFASRHRTKAGRALDVTLEVSNVVLGGRQLLLAVVTDVTGIAEAERRFRLLVEHSADGISLTNERGVVEYVSPGGKRILGYDPGEVVGTSSADRTHPDDLPRWIPPAPGEVRHHVSRIRHRDGSWRWIESTTTNLTRDSAVRAFVSNYRDITERKLAEGKLLDAQQRLEYLLSATSAITYTVDTSTRVPTFISANVEEVLGYRAEVLCAEGFWQAQMHPDDVPAVNAELARLGDRETVTLQYRFRHRDGGYRWIRDVARLVRETGELVGYGVDVTDQVRAESSLRRSEASFRTLIERAPTATFVHHRGCYRYLNPAAVALLGHRSADEIVGRSVLEFIHPDDREIVRARIEQVAHTGIVGRGVARMMRADGSMFVIEAEGMLLDFDGEPCNVVMGHDVTERHEVFARMALADRMLSVGTLAAGVAHEVNNPLAYVATNLEVIAAELPNLQLGPGSRLDAAALHGLVADARDGVSRVSAIVRDLRSLSRPDDDRRGPVDVVPVLATAIKMAHNEIRHRAQVIQSYAPQLPPVQAEASRLGQVCLNLLLNAAQSIAEGHADRNEIRIHAIADHGVVRIAITDTGAGIAPSIRARIFDPFFTTKAPGAGVGLGLSISHQIVRSMNGEIAVDSEPGRGSTFTVTLPVASAPRIVEVVEEAPAYCTARRILLIDDEVAVGRALRVLLAPETEVVAVNRADDALARLGSGERFDAIVCDLMMPEISGIELYGRLSRVAPDCTDRIIFMTGGAFTPQAREFLAKLDRPHLEKPFSEAQLRRVIERVVARHG